MKELYSTFVGWMIPVVRAMEACGIDSAEALAECGIDVPVQSNLESRMAIKNLQLIIDYCNAKSQKNDFSIHIAKNFHPGTFHVLGYAMMTSSSLLDALLRIAQYKRVVSNSCGLTIVERDTDLILDMDIHNHPETQDKVLSLGMIEMFMGTIVQLSKEIVNQKLCPKKLSISHPKPNHSCQYLQDFFQCEIEFGSESNQLIFNLKQAKLPLLGANPFINQSHDKLLDEFLSRVDKDDLHYLVKTSIYKSITLGSLSISDISEKLNLSVRSFQRKLRDQGTSYQNILENTRKTLAVNYVEPNNLSLSEICFLVGYSNSSNFNRAFKRWTNLSPGEYRKVKFGLETLS